MHIKNPLNEQWPKLYFKTWSLSEKILPFDRLSNMNYCSSKDYQADQIYNFLLALHCIHDFFALLLHMDRYLVPAVPKVLKNIQKTVRVKTSLQMMSSKLFRNKIFRTLKISAVLGPFMFLSNNFYLAKVPGICEVNVWIISFGQAIE